MDLNILPLARQNGQDQPSLPGLHIAAPPRRTARGRQADRLTLHLTLAGNAPLSASQLDQILARLAKTYYKSPGSVTAAMRTVAENLNQYLLDRNRHGASSGLQTVGLLTLITLRGEQLYLGQCGPVQAFLITADGARGFSDPEGAHRGLGLGRTTPLHYAQAHLSANDTLLLAAAPPPSWTPISLSGLYGQGPESLRRRLLGQAGPHLNAVLIQAKNGPGKTYLLVPKPDAPLPAAAEPMEMQPEEPAEIQQIPEFFQAGPEPESIPPEILEEAPLPQSASLEGIPPAPVPSASVTPPPIAKDQPPSPTPILRKQSGIAPLTGILAAIGRAFAGTLGYLGKSIRTLLRHMLPGEGIFTLPAPVMAFFAIAVPLVVVSIAMVVYFQVGLTDQYDVYMQKAQQAAEQARAQSDPEAQRAAWNIVLSDLKEADTYKTTDESKKLRAEAQIVFDQIDGVKRLLFQAAIPGETGPSSQKFKRILATESDLYMLDVTNGTVMHAYAVGQSYEMDGNFQCGPGTADGLEVGPLIDIALLPKSNTNNAVLLGMDANGNLLYCAPNEAPQANPLAPPPANFGTIKAFTINLGSLYVLDPSKNAVWAYWDGNFTSQPQLFFAEDIPPMQDVTDLAVDKDDLYLLHSDGHITLCTYSSLDVSPTRCNEPAPYLDSRPGRENQILIPQAPFTQIFASQPPDPSLYLMQPDNQAIFRFSLRLLTFQRQFRPDSNSEASTARQPVSAFTLSPDNRTLFMAIGNQIYFAPIP